MPRPRALITGASGLVGSALVRHMLAHGLEVDPVLTVHRRPLEACARSLPTLTANLRDAQECYRVCQGMDWVLHASGAVGSAGTGVDKAMELIVDSVVQTTQLLQAAWAAGVKRVLLITSTTGYPESDQPIQEDSMFSGDPPPNYISYGHTHRYREILAGHVSRNSSTQVLVVRPSAVYGPRDLSTHVIPALLGKAKAALDPFEVWGTGREERDFVFVDDLAAGCWAAMERLQPGRPVNLASGQATTIRELVETVLRVTGHRPAQVNYAPDKPTNIDRRCFDVQRARQELGFTATTSLEDGLRKTWDWMCAKEEQHG